MIIYFSTYFKKIMMYILDKRRNLTILHRIIYKIVKNLTITRPSNIKQGKHCFHICRDFDIRMFQIQTPLPNNFHARQQVLQEISSLILRKVSFSQLDGFIANFKFQCRSKVRKFDSKWSQSVFSIKKLRMVLDV